MFLSMRTQSHAVHQTFNSQISFVSQLILNGTVTSYTVSEKWKQHVKKLSESGSLTLQDISADQEGIYTCEVNDAEETTISLRSVMIHKGKVAFSHT